MNKKEAFRMRKYVAGLVTLILLLGVCSGCATQSRAYNGGNTAAPTAAPNVVITPSVAPYGMKTQILILGSGFEPGQEVLIMFDDRNGIPSIVEDAFVANENGSWGFVWSLGRYSRGVIPADLNTIKVIDTDFNVLATAPIGFVNTKKPQKEWPDWALPLIK